MLVQSPMKKENVTKGRKKRRSDDAASDSLRQAYNNKRSNHGRRKKSSDEESSTLSLPNVKPWKVIVGTLILGTLGIAYISHVFATQELLQDVQKLERKYKHTKRAHDRYRLKYDQMIGPAAIYENAKKAGFVNGGPAEKVITIEQ